MDDNPKGQVAKSAHVTPDLKTGTDPGSQTQLISQQLRFLDFRAYQSPLLHEAILRVMVAAPSILGFGKRHLCLKREMVTF
jgi:hypothetical protein